MLSKRSDGRDLAGWDSRGRTTSSPRFTCALGVSRLEEFDIRNATYPLNPGDVRRRIFWVQATPAKRSRSDLNYSGWCGQDRTRSS